MKVWLAKTENAAERLKTIALSFEYVSVDELQVVEIPGGEFEEDGLAEFLQNYAQSLPNKLGNYIVNVLHSIGSTGPLIGSRNSYRESVERVIAGTIVRYERHNSKPIGGFLVRFIPKIDEELCPENTVTRIFVVVE